MPARLDYNVVAPDGLRAVRSLDQYLRKSGLEPGLVELVKLRASLLNGCTYCVDLHAREALAKGETERRLFAVPVWREGPFFTSRERAALAWTEAVTNIGRDGVNDALYDEARAHFSEKELVDLTVGRAPQTRQGRAGLGFERRHGPDDRQRRCGAREPDG